jgi:hypothetical protein
MEKTQLDEIIAKHKLWLGNQVGGVRADLSRANLSFANLSRADLSRANLSRANLSFANLSFADLSFADLSDANLSDANLSDANLSRVREDLLNKLEIAKKEAPGLYDAIQRGLIDGSCYSGECCCFVGTIANIRGEDYRSLGIELIANSASPVERWFLAIRPGDTPLNNQISKLTASWIWEWCTNNGIALPEYKLVSSVEFPAAFGSEVVNAR